jgi:uncharacterized protein (UPF0335 family)
MTDNRLKSLAERIERLMDERDALGADIREVFLEVKSAGYVPKVLRKAITRKRMDASKRDEEDAILELYEGALGAVGKAVAAVRAGSTWKEASEEHGVPRATLARAVKAVSIQQNDTDDVSPETVPDAPGGGAEGPRMASGTSPKPYCRECEGTGIIVYDDGGKIHGQEPCPICRVEEEPPTDEAGAVAEPSAAQRVADHEIDLTIPARLDRRARA